MLCIPRTNLQRRGKSPTTYVAAEASQLENLGAPSAQAVGISRRHRKNSLGLCVPLYTNATPRQIESDYPAFGQGAFCLFSFTHGMHG